MVGDCNFFCTFARIMNSFNHSNFLQRIPPATRNLLIINIGLWVLVEVLSFLGGSLSSFSSRLVDILGLHYWGASEFNPAQLVTYMFMHSPKSIVHLLMNMFTLWMFGRLIENVWGAKRFLVFYFVCGIGAALVQELVWQFTCMHDYVSALAQQNGLPFDQMKTYIDRGMATGDMSLHSAFGAYKNSLLTIGASGAVFGLLLAFAFIFPNMPLYLFFIPVPIKAKYLVIGYGVIEFFLGVSNSISSVAHFAHLGGMLFGLILLLYWKRKGTLGGNFFH